MKEIKVSIIIPAHVTTRRFFDDLYKFNDLDYRNYEILIISDKPIKLSKDISNSKVIYTKRKTTGPAEKRDIGLKYSKGEILAFIDDDAYPDSKWLTNSVKWFSNSNIVAVGGPGLTPMEDSWLSKLGGHIISSYLCSGGIQHRYYITNTTKPGFVDDWPAYNLLIRKSILKKVGGFGSTYYGGEDTYVCMLIKKYGLILFDPTVVVYHHRRAFIRSHLNQIHNVGIHRGYFFKTYPETSRRVIYLLPSLATVGLISLVISAVFKPQIFLIPLITILLGFLIVSYKSISRHNSGKIMAILGSFGIIFTHLTYGTAFIKGVFIKKLLK